MSKSWRQSSGTWSGLWDRLKTMVPGRAATAQPSSPTRPGGREAAANGPDASARDASVRIAPSPHHSLAIAARQATEEAFAARCASFRELSIRTPFLRYSGQKLNETARLLRGLSLPTALRQMQFHDRKGARLAAVPLLRQAINAVRQMRARPDDFLVRQALVGRGRYRKRIDIKGRGRMGLIRRPTCFLRIVVARADPVSGLAGQLRRGIHRSLRRVLREDKPAYVRLWY